MRRQIIILLSILVVMLSPIAEAQTIRRGVGATTVVPDMSLGPQPWWPLTTGRPLAETLSFMAGEGVTIVGSLLRAHPTANEYEDIQAAFRNPNIDVLVITPLHWSTWTLNASCNGGARVSLDFPADIFEMLYEAYGNEEKTIIVSTNETDWQMHGVACRGRERCVLPTDYDWCLPACADGTLAPSSVTPDGSSCMQQCCDLLKTDRGEAMLEQFNTWQAAATAARAAHPDATLRVEFSIEVNMFGNQPWQFQTVSADIIPRMPIPPDKVGMSLYKLAGNVSEALDYVLENTGLPVDQIFISEFGAREGTQPLCPGKTHNKVCGTVVSGLPQYERITHVVDTLFRRGIDLALVWSYEEVAWTGGHTGFAVIDPVTNERLSGHAAIRNLNRKWGVPGNRVRRGGRRIWQWTPTPSVTPTPAGACDHCPPPDSIGCIISWPACVQCWEDCGQPIATPTPVPTWTPTPTPTPNYSSSPLVTISAEGFPTHCTWIATHSNSGQLFTGDSPGCAAFTVSFPLVGTWILEVTTHYEHGYEGTEVLESGDVRGDVDGDGLYEYVVAKTINVLAGPSSQSLWQIKMKQ